MNCLICLKSLPGKATQPYHGPCLDSLFGTRNLDLELAESRQDLVTAMPRKTHGFSISGVQMKAQLAIRDSKLKLVDSDGQFIMKPSPEEYPHVAENEHATLRLMGKIGFDVPPCGLIRLKDGHLVFVIHRYDRDPNGHRIHQEDAMQALGIANKDSTLKYNAASYQTVLELVVEHAGLAVAMELLERLIFSYLVGNDDHHLKNISFFHEPVFRLTPCYDVLASALYSSMALAMLDEGEPEYCRTMGNGYYSGSDFIELGVTSGLVGKAVRKRIETMIKKVSKTAPAVINDSFMPDAMKARYQALVSDRLRFLSVM